MEPLAFIHALQLADSFFPVGAFAYSDGLETAAANGQVTDSVSLAEWMDHFVERVFVPWEGLAVLKCMLALKNGDLEDVLRIDEELSAMRPAAASRRSSVLIGKQLLSLHGSVSGDKQLNAIAGGLPCNNAATAYALVFFLREIPEKEGVMAYGYSRLAGIVSAGLRLISIGQREGQAILTKVVRRLPEAAEQILEMRNEPLRAFSPLLDIQQMNHQYLYSRMFRS